jgi:selenide,water dikinase
MSFNLLEFSKGGGCGCKIEPQKLKTILSDITVKHQDNVLVDFSGSDDAAVIDLGAGQYLIQTTDFFLPVVADPYDFGRIAACNALSDVYAMGGKPLTALSVLGWPVEKIPLEVAKEVIRGANAICLEAGISISGGHSIETSDPIFGLSVSGLVAESNLKRNNTCQPGDKIYLSKPLGLGLLANAVKTGAITEQGYAELIQWATKLNVEGMQIGNMPNVSAMTDVTGFGLLGHLTEMLGNDNGARLVLSEIPVIEEARQLAMAMQYPNITTSNYNFVKDRCTGLNGLEFLWLCDPQTSGGLLFTSSEPIQISDCYLIGEVLSGNTIEII